MLSDIGSPPVPRRPSEVAAQLAIAAAISPPTAITRGKLDLELSITSRPGRAGSWCWVERHHAHPLGGQDGHHDRPLHGGSTHRPAQHRHHPPTEPRPRLRGPGGHRRGRHAQVVPMEMNLHLTGIFALTAAHNPWPRAASMPACSTNANSATSSAPEPAWRGSISTANILWPAPLDAGNDRAPRHSPSARAALPVGVPDRFVITAASELMAILALARISGLARAHRPHPARPRQPRPAHHRRAAGGGGGHDGAAQRRPQPTLMQTTEQTPVLVHAGPLPTSPTATPPVIADRMALGLADYVVTEAGFGSDMGLEKFFNIRASPSGHHPRLRGAGGHGARPQGQQRPARHPPGPAAAGEPVGEDLPTNRAAPTSPGILTTPAVTGARGGRHQPLPHRQRRRAGLLEEAARQAGALWGRPLPGPSLTVGAGAADLARAVVVACEQPSEPRAALPR